MNDFLLLSTLLLDRKRRRDAITENVLSNLAPDAPPQHRVHHRFCSNVEKCRNKKVRRIFPLNFLPLWTISSLNLKNSFEKAERNPLA